MFRCHCRLENPTKNTNSKVAQWPKVKRALFTTRKLRCCLNRSRRNPTNWQVEVNQLLWGYLWTLHYLHYKRRVLLYGIVYYKRSENGLSQSKSRVSCQQNAKIKIRLEEKISDLFLPQTLLQRIYGSYLYLLRNIMITWLNSQFFDAFSKKLFSSCQFCHVCLLS